MLFRSKLVNEDLLWTTYVLFIVIWSSRWVCFLVLSDAPLSSLNRADGTAHFNGINEVRGLGVISLPFSYY